MFRLHYWISNNGDGSASVHFTETHEQAEQAEEEMDEPWGEPCAGHVDLEIQDGKIVMKDSEWDGKKHNTVYRPLEEIEEAVKKAAAKKK